jgi:hypothetical protein
MLSVTSNNAAVFFNKYAKPAGNAVKRKRQKKHMTEMDVGMLRGEVLAVGTRTRPSSKRGDGGSV